MWLHGPSIIGELTHQQVQKVTTRLGLYDCGLAYRHLLFIAAALHMLTDDGFDALGKHK